MKMSMSACFAILAQAFAQCALLPPDASAATVMPVWQNDTAANTMSFNDTFGHQVSIGTYNSSTGVWSIPTGSFSLSETFTGGLISVAGSPAGGGGTFALTVAGTSGGIPYFASGTTWASSGALGANQIVLGGGAGAAPSTPVGLGTTTQVLHGNASGSPTFGSVVSADTAFTTLSASGAVTLSANTVYSQPVLNPSGTVSYAPIFDVTAFGAVGDGATNNNTAITNALTAAVASGGHIRFPCGNFKLTAAMAATVANGTNLTIQGGGQDCTVIAFSGSSGTGFTFTYSNPFSSVNVKDLTITTDQAGATGGTAIHLLSTGAPANPGVEVGSVIDNVSIRGSDVFTVGSWVNYWLKSVWQDNISNLLISNSTFIGPHAANGGKMLTMNGNAGSTTYAVATTLNNDNFADCGQCIQVGSYYQGLSITGTNFTGGVNAIEVPSGLTGSLDELTISASQFGFFTGNIVDIKTVYDDVLFSNNEFDLNTASTTAINYTGTFYSIVGNSIFSTVGTGTTGIALVFTAASGNDLGVVSDNSFFNVITGISIASGVTATVRGNAYSSVTTPVSNSAPTTVTTTDFGDITSSTTAPASYVGQTASSNIPAVSAVSLTSTMAATVTSVSLTAGHWMCGGDIAFSPAGGTTIAGLGGGINTTPATIPPSGTGGAFVMDPSGGFVTGAGASFPVGQSFLDITSSATAYLVADAIFGASTMGAYGNIYCLRVR